MRFGPLTLTETVCFRSPSCGCLNTISCDPILTGRFAIGVWPTLLPSRMMSAHGRAFTLTDAFGASTRIAVVRPATTSILRTSSNPSVRFASVMLWRT